jgi:hypothetical protein
VAPVRITYILSAKLGNGMHKGDIISTAASNAKNSTKNFLQLLITIVYIGEGRGNYKIYEMKKIVQEFTLLRFEKCQCCIYTIITQF